MNKKAQSGLGVMLMYLIVGCIYFFGLTGWVAQIGATYSTGETGIWAFFMANLNLVFSIMYFIGLIAIARFGI